MEFKGSFLSRLFGGKPDADMEGKMEGAPGQEESTRSAEEGTETLAQEEREYLPPDVRLLEFPEDHALRLLYELRREQSGLQPPFYIYLEDVPQEEAERELKRLKKELTEEAALRLSEAVPEASDTSESPEDSERPEIVLDARPFVFVSEDRMAAWMMVFPPVGNGKEPDCQMLERALAEKGVAFGINGELLKRLPEDLHRYFRFHLAAKGAEAVDGEDGYLVDHFSRVIERKFQVDEHDRVDYSSLNLVQNADKGEVICEAVPPVKGISGRTVYDEEIPGKDGKAAQLPRGRNTEISEDGTKLVAAQAGHVEFSGRSFQIKTILEINGNVDYTTGNINFLGDVHIRGDVCSGFTVRAVGDITVDGVVESGEVEAGGDLIVVKGIVGNRDSVIRAHHNIYARYLENSIVHARGNLQTDCILHSEVYCDGEVKVLSGKGAVIGGYIRAARGIEAKVIGSKSESNTNIALGGQPCADFEREVLFKEIDGLKKEMLKLERQPESPARTKRMAKIRLDLSVGRMKLGQYDKDLEKIKEKLEEQGGSRLRCQLAYPGLILTIGDETKQLTNETSMCNARLVEGEIQWA